MTLAEYLQLAGSGLKAGASCCGCVLTGSELKAGDVLAKVVSIPYATRGFAGVTAEEGERRRAAAVAEQ
jgi:hypothetical protein